MVKFIQEKIPFSDLKGKTFKSIVLNRDNDLVTFITYNAETIEMCHWDSCCEEVTLDDIAGDLDDLLDSEILLADDVSSKEDEPNGNYRNLGSHTWTFYKLSTIKGSVTFRWYGTSNGCYSEDVGIYITI